MKFSAPAVCVQQQANIDTDQIIPARFLKVTDKAGISRHLFNDRPDLLPPKNTDILVVGDNFGCGSSREHAVWALAGHGIRAVISTSFADIFRQNALKNGLLPIVVDGQTHASIQPGVLLSVDLGAQTLSIEGGPTVTFPIDSFARICLLENIDELGFILKHEAAIAAFEQRN
jgi:3-isopropylmalate/(R)-2-methylmalate dehydratase small subunit